MVVLPAAARRAEARARRHDAAARRLRRGRRRRRAVDAEEPGGPGVDLDGLIFRYSAPCGRLDLIL